MSLKTVTLDVREDLRRGREPFSRIMQTVSGLKADEQLLLIAPFEPKPLFGVLAQHGFSHEATPTAAGDWEVLFTRGPGQTVPPGESSAPASQSPRSSAQSSGATPAVVDVDARGLEPPQPLVKILEALASLPAGAVLRARTDLRPMHLYAQLKARGFTGQTQEQSDGSFLTTIRPAAAA
jgi:uncharacterized protein (DUF2249 family)